MHGHVCNSMLMLRAGGVLQIYIFPEYQQASCSPRPKPSSPRRRRRTARRSGTSTTTASAPARSGRGHLSDEGTRGLRAEGGWSRWEIEKLMQHNCWHMFFCRLMAVDVASLLKSLQLVLEVAGHAGQAREGSCLRTPRHYPNP
jgi:hypothetical protein